MKKLISVLFILILSLSLCTAASADVTDDAHLLNSSELLKLEERSNAISNKYDCLVMVYTADSLGGYYSAESAARDILHSHTDTNDGVIFYIAMESRDWHVYTTGDAWNMFNSAAMDEIEQTAVEYLSEGRYYKAFDAYLDVAGDVLEANTNGKAYVRPAKIKDLLIYLAVAAVIAFIIAIVWVSILKSQLTSVKFQRDASAYKQAGSLNITDSRDIFLYKNVTFIPRPKSSSSSGRSSGGGGGSRGGRF